MAVTGFILFGYLVLHLWGNLKIFVGPEALNGWGSFLRVFGEPVLMHEQLLWLVRIILLLAVILHIWAAYSLTRMSQEARPKGYTGKRSLAATYASLSMRWSGVLVAVFIVYHILHFTVGTVHPTFIEGQPFHNVTQAFKELWISSIYIVVMLVIGLHLYHGLWSMFQTLGWNNARTELYTRSFARLFALAITAGNVAIPVAVLTGVVK
jgi:succinate dehydrogenase / fumarate reductase cytochrome b subunit